MAINPQSISSIGQSVDLGGAVEKAYTLSDAIDRSQMNKMTLASAKEEAADNAKVKKLTEGVDFSDPEARNALVGRISKEVGGRQAMAFERDLNANTEGRLKAEESYLQNLEHRSKIFESATEPFVIGYQEAKAKGGASLQEYEATVLPAFQKTAKDLMEQKLPNGKPLLDPAHMQAIQTALSGGPGSTMALLQSVYTNSQDAQTKIAARRRETLGEKNVQSEIETRGNKIETVMKNGRPMRVEFNAKGEEVRTLGEAPPTAATVQVGGPNAQSLLGELALRGVNIPARTAGAVVAGLKKNYPGKSDAELADMVVTGKATLAGVTAEKRVEGAQVGKIETAIREIPQFAEKALAASAKVPRGEFRPFNKLRLYAETELSNPDLKELKSYLNSLSNAYDVAAARGGTDVNKRAEAHAMLDAADSPETLARAIKVMQDEAAIALKAGQSALRGDQPPPAVSGTTPVPSPATGGTGAAGGTKIWEMKGGKLVRVQ